MRKSAPFYSFFFFKQLESHDFLLEFIELNHSKPCLQDVKSHDYSDRVKYTNAHDELKEKLSERNSDVTRAAVVKKIDSLRVAFRREH